MKKQILLLASIVFTTLVMAQTKPTFGVRAGLSSATLQGDANNSLKNMLSFANGNITTTNHTGFFAGAYATVPVSDIISFEPGLYYTQKGYELKGSFNLKGLEFLGANAKARLNSQYIDVPLLVKANVGGLQLFAGPEVSYLAQADLHTTAGAFGFNALNNTSNVTDNFNRWDTGLTGGIGYQFTNGFNIMAAYDYGLSRVDANKSFNSYNRSFKIGFGYNFK
jgi:hypothetical protein